MVAIDILDLADPTRLPRRLLNAADMAVAGHDKHQGIWLSRSGVGASKDRCASKGDGGVTLGAAIAHWRVAIDGHVYEIGTAGRGFLGADLQMHVAVDESVANYQGWVPLRGRAVVASRAMLRDFAMSFDGRPYNLATANCQHFVIEVISHAADISYEEAEQAVNATWSSLAQAPSWASAMHHLGNQLDKVMDQRYRRSGL
mmetsp:Transcript_44207/g.102097  ORF Transcript_44207/g.102097 Transcript_44207/m.102097 type:complete len:201 (+) Transcript_44207:58-660(+)